MNKDVQVRTLATVITLAQPFVLLKMYQWYVLPIFPEAPNINYAAALLTWLVFTVVNLGPPPNKYADADKLLAIGIRQLFMMGFILVLGWMVK